jgi:hypothetical protein
MAAVVRRKERVERTDGSIGTEPERTTPIVKERLAAIREGAAG